MLWPGQTHLSAYSKRNIMERQSVFVVQYGF
jgi:hypothetical protein